VTQLKRRRDQNVTPPDSAGEETAKSPITGGARATPAQQAWAGSSRARAELLHRRPLESVLTFRPIQQHPASLQAASRSALPQRRRRTVHGRPHAGRRRAIRKTRSSRLPRDADGCIPRNDASPFRAATACGRRERDASSIRGRCAAASRRSSAGRRVEKSWRRDVRLSTMFRDDAFTRQAQITGGVTDRSMPGPANRHLRPYPRSH
jgi:hypothetical protein